MSNNLTTKWLIDIEAALIVIEYNFNRLSASKILKEIERCEARLANIYELLDCQGQSASLNYHQFLSIQAKIEHIKIEVERKNATLWRKIQSGFMGMMRICASIFGFRQSLPALGMEKPLMLTYHSGIGSRY